jgi:hypothetical protein
VSGLFVVLGRRHQRDEGEKSQPRGTEGRGWSRRCEFVPKLCPTPARDAVVHFSFDRKQLRILPRIRASDWKSWCRRFNPVPAHHSFQTVAHQGIFAEVSLCPNCA